MGVDVIKLMQQIAEDNPTLKKMIDEDDKWKVERFQRYIKEGYNKKESSLKAWEDYWEMANKRDGVEFSIHSLDTE